MLPNPPSPPQLPRRPATSAAAPAAPPPPPRRPRRCASCRPLASAPLARLAPRARHLSGQAELDKYDIPIGVQLPDDWYDKSPTEQERLANMYKNQRQLGELGLSTFYPERLDQTAPAAPTEEDMAAQAQRAEERLLRAEEARERSREYLQQRPQRTRATVNYDEEGGGGSPRRRAARRAPGAPRQGRPRASRDAFPMGMPVAAPPSRQDMEQEATAVLDQAYTDAWWLTTEAADGAHHHRGGVAAAGDAAPVPRALHPPIEYGVGLRRRERHEPVVARPVQPAVGRRAHGGRVHHARRDGRVPGGRGEHRPAADGERRRHPSVGEVPHEARRLGGAPVDVEWGPLPRRAPRRRSTPRPLASRCPSCTAARTRLAPTRSARCRCPKGPPPGAGLPMPGAGLPMPGEGCRCPARGCRCPARGPQASAGRHRRRRLAQLLWLYAGRGRGRGRLHGVRWLLEVGGARVRVEFFICLRFKTPPETEEMLRSHDELSRISAERDEARMRYESQSRPTKFPPRMPRPISARVAYVAPPADTAAEPSTTTTTPSPPSDPVRTILDAIDELGEQFSLSTTEEERARAPRPCPPHAARACRPVQPRALLACSLALAASACSSAPRSPARRSRPPPRPPPSARAPPPAASPRTCE